jgi:acyl-CoA thioester hydrolase
VPRVYVSPVTVQPSDIDALGHVNNQTYLRWMQEVAIAHSAAQGWPMERYLSAGSAWVVRSHFVEYLRPAFAADDLRVATWVAEFDTRKSPRRYLFSRGTDPVARAETMWVYVDLATGRPTRIPDDLRQAFEIVSDDAEVHAALSA